MENKRFFFNEWGFLAKVDPELFELRRKKAIEELLRDSGKPTLHHSRLQSEIDTAKDLDKDPQQTLLESAKELRDQLTLLENRLALMKVMIKERDVQ